MLMLSCCFSTSHAEDSLLNLKQMLLMPGKLVEAHAEIEPDCHKCHVHFDKKNQTPLCLDCHEEVSSDVSTGRGYHGRLNDDQKAECVNCHTEHQGRMADIVGLDPDRFSHEMTEFPLRGAHLNRRCGDCHETGNGFRLTDTDCADCHRDVHDGQLGTTCTNCHSEDSWTTTSFDHAETDFTLLGGHQDVSCSSCHLDAGFALSTTQCVDCHLGKDVHLGRFGAQCNDCHQPESWDMTRFDHDRDTKFSLKAAHGEIACTACHRKGQDLALPMDCISCHQADDRHRGANGRECDSCHSEQGWGSTKFDHDTDTDFALAGSHRELACEGCHLVDANGQPATPGSQCIDCHEAIDPHQGRLGEACDECHGNDIWSGDVRFSHEFTKFPLAASHRSLPCEACHFSASFGELASDCQSCHLGDDAHDGALGESCNQCHNPAAWISWRFDHSQQTDYPLEGAHASLSCALCHQGEAPSSLHPATRCISCHTQDDVHRGGFGSDCSNCHSTETFEGVR